MKRQAGQAAVFRGLKAALRGPKEAIRRPGIRIVVLTVWCVVLSLAVVLSIKLITQHRLTQKYSVALGMADAELQSGKLGSAADALRSAARSSQTAAEWLSVLKRAREASRLSGKTSWDLVEELGREAVHAFPGNQDLWAVLIWAEMQDGKSESAAQDARTYLTDGRYESLRLQAFFQSGATGNKEVVGTAPERGASRSTTRELRLLSNLSGSHDPDAFRIAGDLTGDHRFYVDFVLLEAEHSVQNALRDFGAYNLVQVAPIIGVLLAYDSGDFHVARTYMRSLPGISALDTEMVLLQADMAMAGGAYDNAARMYKELIRQNPDASPVPYQNLAYIESRNDSQSSADTVPLGEVKSLQGRLPRTLAPQGNTIANRLLAQGLSAFPNNPDLVRARAHLLVTMGNTDLASTIVAGYLDEHPQDTTMKLYRILRLMPGVAPQRSTALMWDLINADPNNALVGQALANRLLSVRDYDSLAALVRRYQTPPAWIRYYAAISAAARQQTGVARSGFETIWKARADWQAAYDIALTYLDEGSIEPAQEYLDKAQEAADNAATVGGFRNLRGFGPSNQDSAMLDYYRAETLAAQAEQERALEVARKAAALAPESVETSLLVRKLEAAIQR